MSCPVLNMPQGAGRCMSLSCPWEGEVWATAETTSKNQSYMSYVMSQTHYGNVCHVTMPAL